MQSGRGTFEKHLNSGNSQIQLLRRRYCILCEGGQVQTFLDYALHSAVQEGYWDSFPQIEFQPNDEKFVKRLEQGSADE